MHGSNRDNPWTVRLRGPRLQRRTGAHDLMTRWAGGGRRGQRAHAYLGLIHTRISAMLESHFCNARVDAKIYE